ncbi:MAG: hydroxymethylglutaryl-CoA reductase, degradative [Candidatus Aenigmarchaeota archaeon]|nr:hydroxymethylglutaryl-CoA reductase, degradative [Candidatus Aenigmarchaeota archaeon]
MGSDISGFYALSVKERIRLLKKHAGLSAAEAALLRKSGALDIKKADMMVENVIGTTQLPMGLATNFLINGKDYLIPMAIEEPSVIAAASYAAKLARKGGGFVSSADPPVMIGQLQLVSDKAGTLYRAREKILRARQEIIAMANGNDSIMLRLGGGAKDLTADVIGTRRGRMLIVKLHVDVRDAMGANAVNTMLETITPHILDMTGTESRLRIISNLSTGRVARAKATWPKDVLGEDVIEGILDAYAFAEADKYRCTTHNKGIMNGMDSVALATGNDFRALEAGAHAYSALKGFKPLTKYEKAKNGDLIGTIEVPIAVGLVGGATKTHPIAQISLKILNVKTAQELAEVIAAVGLAQNFAALRAMIAEGIQKGHMKLHAKNIAVMAGAKGRLIERVAKAIIKQQQISVTAAKEIIAKLKRRGKKEAQANPESKEKPAGRK